MNKNTIGNIKQHSCKHDWEDINYFVCWEVLPEEIYSDSLISLQHRARLSEAISFMGSIGADGLLPIHMKECMKCGLQGRLTIDTDIKATALMYVRGAD